jgi:hypothetical protein
MCQHKNGTTEEQQSNTLGDGSHGSAQMAQLAHTSWCMCAAPLCTQARTVPCVQYPGVRVQRHCVCIHSQLHACSSAVHAIHLECWRTAGACMRAVRCACMQRRFACGRFRGTFVHLRCPYASGACMHTIGAACIQTARARGQRRLRAYNLACAHSSPSACVHVRQNPKLIT